MAFIGATIVKVVTLYKVEIQGRGGDSIHDEYFETQEGAIFASAVDGRNQMPTPERFLKLSNGVLIEFPQAVQVSNPPSDEQIEKLAEKLPTFAKLLLDRKRHK